MFRRYFLLILVFLLTRVVSFAQDPLYGLGDPIFYIHFDAGTPVYGNKFSTGAEYNNFSYTASVPGFGFYTLINNTNVNPNWWPAEDHTGGDGSNGYMLVAKPRDGIPYDVVFQNVANGLCGESQYEASAYFLNLSKIPGGIPPEITLRVVDAVTGNTISERDDFPSLPQLSHDATSTDWVRQILPFTLPAGASSVRLYIMCKTAGGALLDDFAIDDVTVNATGQKIDVMFTGGNPVAKTACSGSQSQFQVTATPPENGNAIKWQQKLDSGIWGDIPDSGTPNYTITPPLIPGIYTYRAASAPPDRLIKFSCSVVSNEITITVKPSVTVSAGPDKFRLRGGAAVVLEGSSNATNLTWTAVSGDNESSLSSTNTAAPLASPNHTTTYRLTAKSDGVNTCGNNVFDEVTVLVADDIDLPNAFTPNGDGINDRWVIGGIESYPNPIVQVYNRNGQLIFRSVGAASPWDGTYKGKSVAAGSYYYIVDLGINGTRLSGSVTVLR